MLWVGLALTRSTGAALALLAGLVVLAALRWGARASAGLAAGLVVAGLGRLLLAGPAQLDRDQRPLQPPRAGAQRHCRRARWPWPPRDGWGSGAVVAALHRERGTSLPRARVAARTAPLTVAVEQGALGLAAWLALLWFAGRRLLAGAGRSRARAGLAAAFVALVVDALLHGALLDDPATWVVLGAGSALAFADRRHRRRRAVPAEAPAPAREERIATPAEPGGAGGPALARHADVDAGVGQALPQRLVLGARRLRQRPRAQLGVGTRAGAGEARERRGDGRRTVAGHDGPLPRPHARQVGGHRPPSETRGLEDRDGGRRVRERVVPQRRQRHVGREDQPGRRGVAVRPEPDEARVLEAGRVVGVTAGRAVVVAPAHEQQHQAVPEGVRGAA